LRRFAAAPAATRFSFNLDLKPRPRDLRLTDH